VIQSEIVRWGGDFHSEEEGLLDFEESRVAPGRVPRTLKLAAALRVQRVPAPAPAPGVRGQGGTEASAGHALIVDDDAAVQPGQLSRAQFLAQLRAQVTATATDELGPLWSVVGCPYIESWFSRNASTPAAQIDVLARRYSGLSSPRAASEYLAPILARLRNGIQRWKAGQDMSGEASAAGLSSPGPAPAPGTTPEAPAGAGAVQMKRGAAAVEVGSPAAILAELGTGASMGAHAGRLGGAMDDDFGDVRIHTGSAAAQKASELGARAFTIGRDIAFAPGEYRPGTPEGDALLAHELAHVQQQRGAALDGAARKRAEIEGPEGPLELEADHAAAAAVTHLHGGSIGRASLRDRVKSSLNSSLSLKRCRGSSPTPTPDFKRDYKTAFNTGWPAHSEATTFDATMPSGGPRTPRSRALFTAIMGANAALRAAYDANTQGLRDFADVYEYPDPPPAAAPPPPPPPTPAPPPPSSGPTPPTTGPRPPTTGPRPPTTPPRPPPPPPAPNAAFLAGITFTGGPGALTNSNQVQWSMRSTTANPGPEVQRRVQITAPPDQVDPAEDRWSELPWTVGAIAGPAHGAHVQPTRPTATPFTAVLSIPSEPSFSPQTQTISVTDTRQTWFQSNIASTVAVMPGAAFNYFAPGTTTPVNYYGGQLGITAWTKLNAPNPRLPVFASATITKNGAPVSGSPTPRRPLPLDAAEGRVGDVTILEGTPPPTTPDVVVVTTSYFIGAATTAFMPPVVETVHVAASPALASGAEAGVLSADNAWITSTLVPHMQRSGAPPLQAGIGGLVAAARLHLQSMIIRSDSANEVTRRGGNPATQVAWYLGSTGRTILLGTGAAGVHDPSTPDFVFVNVTLDPSHPASRRTNLDEMANSAAHEGVHAADTHLGSHDPWDEYKREFRAYWMEGAVGRGLATDQMASPPPIGPRSERANAIFRHLYGSPAYPTVKPSYDGNTAGFKDKVDAMFHPDGVNLTLSITLFDLQREVESYTGTGFAAKRLAIQGKFAACPAPDRTELRTQNQWRILIEAKFTDPAERTAIKGDLTIP